MACNFCDEYTCIEIYINTCSPGVEFPIVAPNDASWNARVEFNGTYIFFGFEVSAGENIVMPTLVFNEDYIHEVRITDEFDITTCYKVRSTYQKTFIGFVPQPPISDIWQWGQLPLFGVPTVTDVTLTGELAPILWLNEQPLDWAQQGIIHTPGTGTIDFSAIGTPFGKFIYQYRNLP